MKPSVVAQSFKFTVSVPAVGPENTGTQIGGKKTSQSVGTEVGPGRRNAEILSPMLSVYPRVMSRGAQRSSQNAAREGICNAVPA